MNTGFEAPSIEEKSAKIEILNICLFTGKEIR